VRYIYDGMLVIQERDVNNLPTVNYTRGHDLGGTLQGAGGIGGLLAWTDAANGQAAFYHADGNGNVTAMVNSQQFVVAKYIYDPFGNILSKSGPLADANTYRFSSQEYHQPSGLSLYLYRAYDPNLQRWLNKDPIGEEGGINLYRFVINSPPNAADPLGLKTISFKIGFDDTAAGDYANLLSIFDSNINGLKKKLAQCCLQFRIGCGTQLSARVDWTVPRPPPKGGYTPGNWADGLKGISGSGIPVLFTNLQVPGNPGTVADSAPKAGILWNPSGGDPGDFVLSHELGHVGGYENSNNPTDIHHSPNATDLMNQVIPNAGGNVDLCYCKRVASLAK